MFRTSVGAVAIEDRCLHRGMPLSVGGRVENEGIQCPYHGMEFDATGACRKIPGQEHIPAGARLRSFPLVERDGTLWIWPGDPNAADPAAIPAYPQHAADGYAFRKTMLTMHCNWEFLNDNLLDLTHLGYVHARTIGGDPDAHSTAIMNSEKSDRSVRVTRHLPASEPPPSYRLCHDFAGKVDSLARDRLDAGSRANQQRRNRRRHRRICRQARRRRAVLRLSRHHAGNRGVDALLLLTRA